MKMFPADIWEYPIPKIGNISFRFLGKTLDEIQPVTTAEYGLSKAARPFNSRLDKSKLVEAGFTPLPTWQDALSRYLKEIEQ